MSDAKQKEPRQLSTKGNIYSALMINIMLRSFIRRLQYVLGNEYVRLQARLVKEKEEEINDKDF